MKIGRNKYEKKFGLNIDTSIKRTGRMYNAIRRTFVTRRGIYNPALTYRSKTSVMNSRSKTKV